MTKDSHFTHILLHASHHADLLEDFTRSARLPAEDIYVPPQHQPLNPDDEDDVVPEQHAAFGIQRATQRSREPAWRDLGLERILDGGPPAAGDRAGSGSGSLELRKSAAAGAAEGGAQESGSAAAGSRVRLMR